MLERVTLGQARFMTPGVAPDPRGVLIGRHGLLLFPTFEGVVTWLRLYSAESSLDELLSGMEIFPGRTPLHSREMAIRIPATSSYSLDRAARCARLAGGGIFTGTGKHFVRYRDDRSPYGYDAVDIHALPEGVDFMIHNLDYTQTYRKEANIEFSKLLFRLSLRPIPGGLSLPPDERAELLLVVAHGLREGVIRYLWRNRVSADVALVRPEGDSAFVTNEREQSYLLMKVREVPERIVALFLGTPGIDVFRPVAANVGVQVGYAHVIDLGSCASVFDDGGFFLFWGETARDGRTDRVDVIRGPVEMSAVQHLTRVQLHVDQLAVMAESSTVELADVGVKIHLAPSLASPRHVIGTLIPLAHGPILKRLVFLLPQSTLHGHRIAVTERGIVLVATENIDVIPLGQLLSEMAPGLLVPLGMDLVPRVAPSVLARALGHGAGMLTVLPPAGNPFQVGEDALGPLERRTLANLEVERPEHIDVSAVPAGVPNVVNRAVGRFALWGFPDLPKLKSLPPGEPGESGKSNGE